MVYPPNEFQQKTIGNHGVNLSLLGMYGAG